MAAESTGLLGESSASHADATVALEHKDIDDFPRKSIAHIIFSAVGYIATLIAGLLTLSQIINFAILRGNISQIVLRCYILVFCVLFIASELKIAFVTRFVPPLKNWIYRGFLYTFIGVIGVEESYAALSEKYPLQATWGDKSASLFLKVCSFAMFFMGVLYMLLGVLCMKIVYDKLENSYKAQVDRFTNAQH